MTDIEENFFNATWETMNKAADKGFRARTPNDPDYDFYQEIRKNNAVFSAFKVHRAQNDMAALLLDKNGNLKPFEQWLKEVSPIADHQVRHWLRTEYDTAVIRAHQAADWRQFEREKEFLPNLKWGVSTSVHPGADHKIFWGTLTIRFGTYTVRGIGGIVNVRLLPPTKNRHRHRDIHRRISRNRGWITIRERTLNFSGTRTLIFRKHTPEQRRRSISC